MATTVQELLQVLPPYRDEWIVINDNQNVPDIIKEVCEAHKEFADHYDKLSSFFDCDNLEDTCDELYFFLKENIKYKEESDKDQTSSIPAGILTRAKGDCKHYSGFAAGVLDAIRRTGKKIKWCYRFASYRWYDKTPHHVFVVVNPGTNKEIWIDPTPGANVLSPVWQIDKKPMALRRNIAGLEEIVFDMEANTVGLFKGKLNLSAKVNTNPLVFNGKPFYEGVFNPYLGLSEYRDGGKDKNINEDDLAGQINQLIKSGPSPHPGIIGSFAEWVWYENIRSWNFFYPGGIKPGFAEIAATLLPADYPKLIITADGRLTFDRDQKIDDYQNPYIHILTGWAQDLINRYDKTPYPVKPRHLKEFSQLKYGNLETRNLFTERRGESFLKDVGKAIEKAVNFVKDGVLLIVGSIPRNAFLGLVGINAFGFATNMAEKIDNGQWPALKKKWENLGGNPDKLFNTIEDGKKKKAILGETGINYIGAEPATTGTAALLAAAAPIIAALIAFLDKDGKAKEIIQASLPALKSVFPGIDFDGLNLIDKNTNKPIEFTVRPEDNELLGGGNNDLPGDDGIINTLKKNPLPVALGAGLITYFATGKKSYTMPAIVALAAYFLMSKSE